MLFRLESLRGPTGVLTSRAFAVGNVTIYKDEIGRSSSHVLSAGAYLQVCVSRVLNHLLWPTCRVPAGESWEIGHAGQLVKDLEQDVRGIEMYSEHDRKLLQEDLKKGSTRTNLYLHYPLWHCGG